MSDTTCQDLSRSPSVVSIVYSEELRREISPRVPALFSSLNIRAGDIEYIDKGLYNIVYGFIDMSTTKNPLRCILRIQINEPNEYTVGEMTDSAAILEFLSSRTNLTQRVIYMDTSASNPLLKAFTIQPRLEGVTFAEAWDDMSLNDHIHVGKMVVDKLLRLQEITFPYPGNLAASQEASASMGQQILPVSKDWPPLIKHPRELTVEGWLAFLIEWRTEEVNPGCAERAYLDGLSKILVSMVSRGYFTDMSTIEDCVFSHGDLHANNIMVARDDNISKTENEQKDEQNVCAEHWSLTGFIDWDKSQSIPQILSFQPLEWLWADHLFDDDELLLIWTGNLDFVPEDKWDGMPVNMKRLKREIDEYASAKVPGYMEKAYGKGRWIRRVAKYAMTWVDDNREYCMLEWMLAEWERTAA